MELTIHILNTKLEEEHIQVEGKTDEALISAIFQLVGDAYMAKSDPFSCTHDGVAVQTHISCKLRGVPGDFGLFTVSSHTCRAGAAPSHDTQAPILFSSSERAIVQRYFAVAVVSLYRLSQGRAIHPATVLVS